MVDHVTGGKNAWNIRACAAVGEDKAAFVHIDLPLNSDVFGI